MKNTVKELLARIIENCKKHNVLASEPIASYSKVSILTRNYS